MWIDAYYAIVDSLERRFVLNQHNLINHSSLTQVLHFTPPYTTCVTNKLHNLQGFKKNKNCIFLIALPRAIENSIRGRLSDTFVGKLKTPCFKESNTCTDVEYGLFIFIFF